MGRKNTQRRGGIRTQRPGRRGAPPPVPIESLIVPRGKCYRNSRKGKLRFSKDEAPEALRQAKAKRQRAGSAYCEERAYECKTSEGGCGDWHLTSRQEYNPKGGTA
jgi:hypothetical protein